MKKIIIISCIILVSIGGCKSFDCGCPMTDGNQEIEIRNPQECSVQTSGSYRLDIRLVRQ